LIIAEKKNVTISDRFICFILTLKQSAALAACVLRLKKVVNFFEEKVHLVTWLEDFLK